jgi:hypothetical protein
MDFNLLGNLLFHFTDSSQAGFLIEGWLYAYGVIIVLSNLVKIFTKEY